jgi:hypothetical protein
MQKINTIGISGNNMAQRVIRMHLSVCSLWAGGRNFLKPCRRKQIKSRLMNDCRYEDEKVIQALEIIKAETGLPFVDYV